MSDDDRDDDYDNDESIFSFFIMLSLQTWYETGHLSPSSDSSPGDSTTGGLIRERQATDRNETISRDFVDEKNVSMRESGSLPRDLPSDFFLRLSEDQSRFRVSIQHRSFTARISELVDQYFNFSFYFFSVECQG